MRDYGIELALIRDVPDGAPIGAVWYPPKPSLRVRLLSFLAETCLRLAGREWDADSERRFRTDYQRPYVRGEVEWERPSPDGIETISPDGCMIGFRMDEAAE